MMFLPINSFLPKISSIAIQSSRKINLRSINKIQYRWMATKFITNNNLNLETKNILEQIREYEKTSASSKIHRYMLKLHRDNKLTPPILAEALLSLTRKEISEHTLELSQLYLNLTKTKEGLLTYPDATISLVVSLKKAKMVNSLENISQILEIDISNINSFFFSSENKLRAFYKQYILELANAYAYAEQWDKSLHVLNILVAHNEKLVLNQASRLLQVFLQTKQPQIVIPGLKVLLILNPGLNNDARCLQLLISNLIPDIEFLKGAVSQETFPEESIPEVAIVGRSNVGKSSLINMLTNRKNLAYTSKTAGKTTEFNFFECSNPQKTFHYHLVDLPGVGFATTSKSMRHDWKDLFYQYAQSRATLSCIFHLVDSRHGLLPADNECLDVIPLLPKHVKYAIILTKIDKYKNQKAAIEIQEIMNKTDNYLRERYPNRDIPVLNSSSEAKVGGLTIYSQLFDEIIRNN